MIPIYWRAAWWPLVWTRMNWPSLILHCFVIFRSSAPYVITVNAVCKLSRANPVALF